MTINFRTDSVTHEVWAQRQASSCAVASIWMARNQAKQMTVNEGEGALAWRLYNQVVQGIDIVPDPPAPMSLDPRAHDNDQSTFGNMFSIAGTFMQQVSRALTNDGLRVTHATSFSAGTAKENAMVVTS